MAFLPSFAWEQKGFDDEQDKSRRLRSENRKALQEASDLAAQQGRELNVDEWFNIVRDQVGTDGSLYNYAPANTVLESMRKSANERAKVVQQERKMAEFNRQTDMDKKIEGVVSEMLQNGKEDAEVVAEIGTNFSPEIAQRYASRVPAIRQKIEVADLTEGARLGDGFESVDDAQKFVDSKPALSQSLKSAIIARAKKNQSRLENEDNKEYIGAISKLEPFAFIDNEDSRKFVESQLPLRMTRDPEAKARHIENAMTAWKSRSQGAEQIFGQSVRAATTTAITGTIPDAIRADKEYGLAQERVDAVTRENANKAPEVAMQRRAAEVKAIFDGKPSNKVKFPALRDAARAFLTEYEVTDFDAVVAAAEQGPEAFAAAKAAAMKTAVPAAQAARRVGREAIMRAGVGLSGDPARGQQEYEAMFRAGENDVLGDAARAGTLAREQIKMYSGAPEKVQAVSDAAAREITREVLRTRELLGQSGKFAISGQRLLESESGVVSRQVAAFSKAAGLDTMQTMNLHLQVMKALENPTDITPRQTPQQAARAGDNAMRSGFGLPSIFSGNPPPGQGSFYRPPPSFQGGQPGAYRPPANPDSPF